MKRALLCVCPTYPMTNPPAGAAALLGYLKAHGIADFGFVDLRLGTPSCYEATYTATGVFGESFVMDVPDDLPLVNVDFVQIEQVFTNLLANSLKYAPAGSTIKILAKPKDVHSLLVTLTNQSMPVPETDLDRIFDKFYRINNTPERVTGSGLGLSICKGIIEAHGGIIWAENLIDGLAFNFTLPVN